jgi:prenyltransferase beta subunit
VSGRSGSAQLPTRRLGAGRRRALLSFLALPSLCVVLTSFTSNTTLASPNNSTNQARLDNTVRFLQNVQNMDGGFSANGNPGEESSADFTSWVTLALAAAGINPQNQAQKGGTSAYSYLAANASSLSLTTDFARTLLVVDASGTAPQDFGGVNLLTAILARQLPDGSFFHEEGHQTPGINDTIFAILALSPIHEPVVQKAIQKAVGWLEGQQDCDGSWPGTARTPVTKCPSGGEESQGEIDMTAAAIEALNAAGVAHSEAQTKALRCLREAQKPGGGFPEFTTESEPNTASTSWAVQAIWAAGENPETWTTTRSKEPLGFLESLQHEDGSIQWKTSSDAYPVWMTAYAAPAYAGQPLPIPPVPQETPSSDATSGSGSGAPPSSGVGERGNGGESNKLGSGAIAGGGGNGAPLFSRPQPQSQGHTPGGARQLQSNDSEIATKHPRNPGRPRKMPVPTITSETHGHRSSLAAAHGNKGAGAGGPIVKGILLGNASNASYDKALEPGAPGLRSAGAGGNETSWLAIGIAVALLLSMLAGMQLERRRSGVTL